MNRKLYFISRRTVAGCLLVSVCASAQAETKLGVDLGFRSDELQWSIPGAFRGKDGVIYQQNIISELTWKNLKSNYLGAHGLFQDGQFVARGDVGYGIINSGDNQDSDYRGNNRTEEFSRSNNKSNGDHVSDAKIGVGLNLDNLAGPSFQFTPMAGISSHVQSLRMTDLNQTVSVSQYAPLQIEPIDVGQYSGLDSSYETKWVGPWVGFNARLQIDSTIAVRANFEHHWADYSGQGNWNLRDCLDHPESFTHSAEGTGNDLGFGADIQLNTNVMLFFGMTASSWITDAGTGTVHLPADYYTRRNSQGRLVCLAEADLPLPQDRIFDFSTQLNEVKWNTRSYLVGINMRL